MVRVLWERFEPDYVLKSAIRRSSDGDEDLTSEIIAYLAACGGPPCPPLLEWKGVLITYTFKGTGPYCYIVSEHNTSFPPLIITNRMISPDKQIVMAERGDEDITDLILQYAGPDGSFHNMIEITESMDSDILMDLRPFFPDIQEGEEVIITFGSGDVVVLSNQDINKEEEII